LPALYLQHGLLAKYTAPVFYYMVRKQPGGKWWNGLSGERNWRLQLRDDGWQMEIKMTVEIW
jgi:hypothetical protein